MFVLFLFFFMKLKSSFEIEIIVVREDAGYNFNNLKFIENFIAFYVICPGECYMCPWKKKKVCFIDFGCNVL